METIETTLIRIPIKKLVISPLNVRKKQGTGIEELAALIASPQDSHADIDGMTAEQDIGFAFSDLQPMQFDLLQESRQDGTVEANLVPLRDEMQPDGRSQQTRQGSAGPSLG